MPTVSTPPASLGDVRDHLELASVLLARWHAAGADYVRAGHDAINAVDDCLQALCAARAVLVGELRADSIDRAVRVDQLLAQLGEDRFDTPPAGPVPEGVEGHHATGRHTDGGAR